VVGLGSSGADIAVEVSQTARHTYLSTANGGWVFPRTIGGRPWDHNLTRLSALVPYRLRMRVLRQLVLAEYRRMGLDGRMSAWGIPEPTFDLWRARFTPSSDLLPRIASGAIAVKPNIARLDAHKVVFTDETRAPVDAVILCTGYAMRFPFFAESLVMATGSDIALYRHVFHPDWPNLAFIGLVIVGGPLLPVAEMQARWVARVFSSTVALPSSVQMRAEIRRRRTRHARRSPYPMRVQLIEYMDELAELIGVRPRWWRHPRLIATLMAGPPLAAQYRLEGDGRFERVATFIQAQQRRP